MVRRVLGLILLLFIAHSLLATESHYATVYVYRPSHFLGAAKRPSIYLDGVEIARLHNGTYLKFDLAAGQHLITSATYVEGNPYLSFEPGKKYFFRLDVGSAAKAAFGERVPMKLVEVPQEQATTEIEKLKEGEISHQPATELPHTAETEGKPSQ